jgi:hypothetical protein
MQIAYRVHRASHHRLATAATLGGGESVRAEIDSFEVELVPSSHEHASAVTLRFIGKDAEKAAVLYAEGQIVRANFAVTDSSSEEG